MFCTIGSLAKLNPKEQYNFENIKIIDIMKSNDDLTTSKPKTLRYFKKPPATAYPLDLNVSDCKYKKRELKFPRPELWLIENTIKTRSILENTTPETTAKICAQRSTLIRIMQIPVDKYQNSAIFNVTKFQDSIYITFYKENQDICIDTGCHFKLKQMCFSDKPNEEPPTDFSVNENEQWWCTYHAKLKHFDVIYSAEINGIEAEKEIQDLSDMDGLNECRFILLRLYGRSLNQTRALRTFLQASLVNVQDIYLAQRNNDDIVETPMQCKSIKTLIKYSDNTLNLSTSFLYNFLERVERQMSQIDCPYTVYQFVYHPKESIFKLKRFKGKNEFSFLSTEFVKHQQQIYEN